LELPQFPYFVYVHLIEFVVNQKSSGVDRTLKNLSTSTTKLLGTKTISPGFKRIF